MKALFVVLIALWASQAVAQTPPSFTWKIVMKNFFNKIESVRPEMYPSRPMCEAARYGMGLADINVLGQHGECVFVPTTFGQRLGRRAR